MEELIEKATDFMMQKGFRMKPHMFWIPRIMAEFADEYHKTQMEKLNVEIRESCEKSFCTCDMDFIPCNKDWLRCDICGKPFE